MDTKDFSSGKVGCPLFDVQIKLKSWKSFTPRDKPHPRGEVLVSGNMVAKGYINCGSGQDGHDLDSENFITESDGSRWFRTGDIGEMFPDGTLRIIDRKNLIVTLDTGDVLSLGKVID